MKDRTLKDYVMPILSMCGMISCSLGICSNVQGVFFAAAAKDLNIMVGTFSMQNTVACIITYILAIYFTKIMDRVSYRKMLLPGAVMTGISFVAMGVVSNLVVFYILGVIRGIGASAFAVAIVTIGINNWFKEKTGLVTSIVFCTSGITGMVLSPVFAWMIEKYTWRTAYAAMGIISFILILPAICSDFTLNPGEKGIEPYGIPVKRQEKKKTVETVRKHNTQNVFMALAVTAIVYNLVLGFSQHLPGYAESIGMSAAKSALLLSLCMFGNVLFKLFSGIISDRFGVSRTTLMMAVMNFLSIAFLFVFRVLWIQEVSAMIFGVVYSIVTVCLSLMAMECCTKEEYRRVYPKISMLGGIANPAAVSLLGYVYDLSGTYNAVFALLFAAHIAGSVMLFYLYNRSRRIEK